MIIDHDSSRRVTGCIGAIVNGVSHVSLKYGIRSSRSGCSGRAVAWPVVVAGVAAQIHVNSADSAQALIPPALCRLALAVVGRFRTDQGSRSRDGSGALAVVATSPTRAILDS